MVFGELDSEFRVVSAGDENAGRGWTIQNLHASEVARWPGDAAATLAGLRAALVPGGEMTLESHAVRCVWSVLCGVGAGFVHTGYGHGGGTSSPGGWSRGIGLRPPRI